MELALQTAGGRLAAEDDVEMMWGLGYIFQYYMMNPIGEIPL